MNDIAIFTDVSLDPRHKRGVGVCLVLPASLPVDTSKIADQIKVRRFEETSSTKLEIRTVLWALGEYLRMPKISGQEKLSLYTDSQCVSGLLKRRPGLLAGNFISKGTNRPLRNSVLYREFFEVHDELGFEVIKVKGHSRTNSHDSAHRFFSLVDREARKELRLWTADEVHDQSWCVYVLKCSNDNLYIGITNDLERRLREHEQGRGSKFVRSWRPFELVKTIPCINSGEARRLEYDLKRLTRKQKIEVLSL